MKRSFDDLSNTNPGGSNQQNTNSTHITSVENSPSAEPTYIPNLPSAQSIASLKATISSLPRAPQISRKVRACSACKKQKIRCDFDAEGGTGEAAKCVRCRKMKLECVVNRSLQTILDEDVEWKMKMTEELSTLQRAVEDILKTKQMRPLSAYDSPSHSTASSCSPAMASATLYTVNSPTNSANPSQSFNKDSGSTQAIVGPGSCTSGQSPDRINSGPRMPMTRENSPDTTDDHHNPDVKNTRSDEPRNSPKATRQPFYDHYPSLHTASISTNPMGSLYEVTRLRSLRSNSTTNVPHSHSHASNESGDPGGTGRHVIGPSGLGRHMSLSVENNEDDLISKGLVSLEEAEELFELFRSTLNHYLFDVALVHDNLTSVRNSSSLLLASILTVAALHRPTTKAAAQEPSSGDATSTSSSAPGGTFGVCYQHFLTLVSSSMFDFPGGYGPHIQQGSQQPTYTRALDNVRALSIAAFWLPDLSWKLSGHAVRIATELNVHQSFRKALKNTPGGSKLTEAERMRREQERKFHYERARLWYLLYVCDHHFSIAYGRPPVICYSQHEAIRDEGYEKYLESDLCKEGDFRVVSQMALFVVLERIYECFAGEISEGGMVRGDVLFGTGSTDNSDDEDDEEEADDELQDTIQDGQVGDSVKGDNEKEQSTSHRLPSRKKRKLEHAKDNRIKKKKSKADKVDEFNRDLDAWRDIWRIRLRKNAFVGDYPAKGVLLHYHFAKLQLNSLALRGVTATSTTEVPSAQIIANFSPQRTAMARLAIESARHVLTTILTVEEIRVCLIGVPLYVHTMIAFAAVFLMKVVSRWRKVATIADLLNPAESVWMLVEQVVEVLRDVAGGGIKEGVNSEGKGKGNKKSPAKDAPSLRGAGEMHIVWYIAGGLEKMVRKCRHMVMKEDEEEEANRPGHTQGHPHGAGNGGKWDAVWQDSAKASTEGNVGGDDEANSKTGMSVSGLVAGEHHVEPKQEEPDYPGNWAQQQHGFSSGNHSPAHIRDSEPQYHANSSRDNTSPHPPPPPPAPHQNSHANDHSASSVQNYGYTTGPASHGIYAFDQHSQHTSDNHHDNELGYDTGSSSIFAFPMAPYEFFSEGSVPTTSGAPNSNGVGYFSFNGFDLFGGGTMEAIPMAGSGGVAGPGGEMLIGQYGHYLHPDGHQSSGSQH